MPPSVTPSGSIGTRGIRYIFLPVSSEARRRRMIQGMSGRRRSRAMNPLIWSDVERARRVGRRAGARGSRNWVRARTPQMADPARKRARRSSSMSDSSRAAPARIASNVRRSPACSRHEIAQAGVGVACGVGCAGRATPLVPAALSTISTPPAPGIWRAASGASSAMNRASFQARVLSSPSVRATSAGLAPARPAPARRPRMASWASRRAEPAAMVTAAWSSPAGSASP
jgi:hypothetical protein